MAYKDNKRKTKDPLLEAIKEDKNNLLGSIVVSKKRSLTNPFKTKWNNVETIVWAPNTGISVCGINSQGVASIERFINKYPPTSWNSNDMFILKPTTNLYSDKELITMHVLLSQAGKTLDDMTPFEMAHYLSNSCKEKKLFDEKESRKATIKDFINNTNFIRMQLNSE